MSAAHSRREQALANYQTIQQHHFHSTVEKAMGDLLLALAEEPAAPSNPAELAEIRNELAALRRELASAPQPAAAAIEPSELAEIRKELAALRRDMMFVASLDPAQGGKADAADVAGLRHEIASLRHEVAELARQTALGVVAPPSRAGYRHAPRHLPGGPAPMRPVEELLDDAPQIDGELSSDQLKSYIERPRVRAEDIQLSKEDIQRQGRGGRLRASDEMRARLGRSTPQQDQATVFMFIGVTILLVVLACGILSL